MDNKTFDETLRRITAEEDLPYAPEAWRKVSARLDAHEGRKRRVIVLTPAALRWAAAAVLIGLALAAGWMLRGEKEEAARAEAQIAHVPTSDTRPSSETSSATPAPQTQAVTAAREQLSVRKQVFDASKRPARFTTTPAASYSSPVPQQTVAASTPATPIVSPESTVPEVPMPQEGVRPKERTAQVIPFAGLDDETIPRSLRSTGFDLAGGYGFSSALSNFTLGVAVKRKLSSRLQLEGGLALVGGSQGAQKSMMNVEMHSTDDNPGPGGNGTSNLGGADSMISVETESARLLYLQAAPTLSYRIYKGFSVGGGPDAQRLLTPGGRAESPATASAVQVPQPEWDFGVAVRADYALTKRLRVGVLYRESLRATAASGRATGRNYWLLQAGYQVR
jgi:hypothetical protein